MRNYSLNLAIVLLMSSAPATGALAHDHPVPEKLGAVTFPTSCDPSVQAHFNRAIALLHSFAYSASEEAFRDVARRDTHCAMAWWGIAMTHYHQLWEPPIEGD